MQMSEGFYFIFCQNIDHHAIGNYQRYFVCRLFVKNSLNSLTALICIIRFWKSFSSSVICSHHTASDLQPNDSDYSWNL